MTIRCSGLLLLNPPKIDWESASATPAVGKAINLDEITERDYPLKCVNAFARALSRRPNSLLRDSHI
jgi:hypothetical protein